MSGIAGVAARGRVAEVASMLEVLSHRGPKGMQVFECGEATLGSVSAVAKAPAWDEALGVVRDETGPGRFACATSGGEGLVLSRDPLGAAPLYLGKLADGTLAFASEVKALLGRAEGIRELPPGSRWEGGAVRRASALAVQPERHEPAEVLARELRQRLEGVVARAMERGPAGSWLSGGLDSSVMVALARPHVPRFHTFAGGLAHASDLPYAREVASFLKTEHHEVVLTLERLKQLLPDVVASLESFDALLVRSSVVNHLVAEAAAQHVDAVFSGEGGDELFGGYAYLKDLPLVQLPAELVDITGRLHNTALQRVDRSASRHGLAVHTCFLEPEVVELALRVPAAFKIHDGIEKWILRKALEGRLPESVLWRPKAKFWEGAGVASLLAELADAEVSDDDFRLQRRLDNGWILDSKEELLNYRHFRERFGELADLDWMGRTKGRPSAAELA